MAYLLYKYIKKTSRERKARQANPDRFENIGKQDQQSPAHAIDTPAASGEENVAQNPDTFATPQNGMPEKNGSTAEPTPAKDTRTKEEKRAMRIYRRKLIAGLFLPFSVQALETTIIAGALPFIASDFSRFST